MSETPSVKPIGVLRDIRPPEPVEGESTGRAKLGLLLTVILLGVAWAHTFSEMWIRWFPHWIYQDATLHDRLTKGDSYYTHGPMVPVVSLIIAFFIYRRVGVPVRRTTGASALGWVLLGVSLVFHLLSVYARVMFVSGFSIIGVLLGLLLIWGGRPLLRAYWLPVAFLAFMVPLPMEMIDGLNYQLKTVASTAAVWATNSIFHVPAILDGSYVHFLPAPDGSERTLVVEDVCSGLRSMISLICFAALFALICRAKGFWRVVMLVMAVPVAIAGNIVRITILNLVANSYGVQAAGPESWFHEFSGVMVFAIALAMLFGLEQIILLVGKLLKQNWSDPRLLGFLDGIPRTPGAAAATTAPAAIGALLLTALMSMIWSAAPVQINRGSQARLAVPVSVRIGDNNFAGQDSVLDDTTLTILETRDYVYRHFIQNATRQDVDLLIVFSPDNRKGTHPPEVCLKGGGEDVISKQIQTVSGTKQGSVSFRELITQRSSRLTYYLYVYKCGDSYTPSFFFQQARIFLNGITRRNAAGALIRLSVPIEGQDIDSARRLGLEAAKALMPSIDQGLP